MSKYHKGDKFIVEIKEVMNSDNGTLYRSDFKTLTFDDNGLDKLQKCETELSWDECYNEGLENGRNEVWELANKIFDMDYHTTDKVFGCDTCEVMKMTPQEAIAKLEAYEKEQNEIKVGDVLLDEYRHRCVVSSDKGCDDYVITFADGSGSTRSADYIKSHFTKTGKHIDIQSVLSQIAE